MQNIIRFVRAIILATGFFVVVTGHAQQLVPMDVGTVVSGYQDDFDGSALDARWLPTGPSTTIYTVGTGILHVSSADGDPNHLLFAAPEYDGTTQEVLARVRFAKFGTGDSARGGVAIGVDSASSQGINFHFRDVDGEGQVGRHLAFLDDLRAWGPGTGFVWENNVWYWMRLRQELNAAFGDGSADIFAKIWLADGSTPEPTEWQTWDYIPAREARSGYAGIAAGSLSGLSEFDVDYILIKAAGLPSIRVAPEAFPTYNAGPVSVVRQPASTNAAQCTSALFSVEADGTPPYQYQWYRDGKIIGGATNAFYQLGSVQIADSGAQFYVVLSNIYEGAAKTATSSIAQLTVNPDQTAPLLLSAENNGLNQVLLTFSEAITPESASQLANYGISSSFGPLTITSATLNNGGTSVLLATKGEVEGVSYTLTLHGLIDQCSGVNVITDGTTATFQAQSYQAFSIGEPVISGQSTAVTGGYDLEGSGSGLRGVADQGQFSYQSRSGDFDLKVRVESLNGSKTWAEAGLMAREDTSAGSRFAAAVATSGISGSMFKARADISGPVITGGSFPVNYPYTWLRLKRVGDLFLSYGSLDGMKWTLLGSGTVVLPNAVLVGYFASSGSASELASAAFRDLATVGTEAVTTRGVERERPAQASRLTSLVLSEIMYHPANREGVTNSLEYVEIFNSGGTSEEISGYRLDGDIHYTFPAGSFIRAGEYLVVAKSPSTIEAVYGITGVRGPFTGNLPNRSGTVQLRNQVDAIFLEVNYGSSAPWPAAADGAGHSLILARPSLGQGQPGAWAASDVAGGSPGRMDSVSLDELNGLVINEFLAHGSVGSVDYVELYNSTPGAMDLTGAGLSDDADTNKFTFRAGTTIPGYGFLALTEAELGFGLKAEGEAIFLRNKTGTRVLDAVRFEAQGLNVSYGRFPDGGKRWGRLANSTPGTANSTFFRNEIIINEIMYAPISLDENDEYIELYNRGSSTVDLSGWSFVSGISFAFPTNTVIGPEAYLVVAKNVDRLRTNYSALNATNLVGNFDGKLSNGGERIALARPEALVSTNLSGVVSTQIVQVTIEEVDYKTGGRWGPWADGGGSSLERINPEADGFYAANWADSEERAKAPWTDVEFSGTLDNGNIRADQLQVLLQGSGECLIDDVQVLDSNNQNLVANSSFESGAAGWTAEGTEKLSSLEMSEGYESAQSYHIRATDRGDNQLNRVKTSLTAVLASGTTATIRAKVRWLRGHPEILFRLRGNWLEAVGEMNLPVGAGTPGQRNSRFVLLPPPAIAEVKHWPVLPREGEPVTISAQIASSVPDAQAVVKYRLDPDLNYSTASLHDDGLNGDALAGDGIYSATIPGQSLGATVAFYVEANNGSASRFPSDAPARECLVRFGEVQPAGSIPVYRLWMTQATLNDWNRRSKLDNSPLDVTFVLGNERVIYNAQALYAGSPYISPGYCGASCGHSGYSITFPKDDLFLGGTDMVLDWPGGHGGETTAIQEQMAYWMANRLGLPYSHRYFIHLHVNGVTDDQRGTIFEAVNQPAGEFIEAWSPKAPEGDFYKIDRAFEFSDQGTLSADPMPTLEVFNTTGGIKKQARYRWNWNKRSADRYNNYTNIFNLVDAANAPAPEPYTEAMESIVDIDEWMGIFAFEHIINNFDSWGHQIGKNMYAYKPDGGKWQLYMFDLDWLMLVSGGTTSSLWTSNDPTVARMYNFPPFRRAYLRIVQEAVNGPLMSGNYESVMDEKYEMLVANGVQYCDGRALTAPTALKSWFKNRRIYLLNQIPSAIFAVDQAPEMTASTNPIVLSGTAPMEVKSILVNGNPMPVTWTSPTEWTLSYEVNAATSRLEIAGYDRNGGFLPSASNIVTVNYTGPVSGYPKVLVNEWMAKNNSTISDNSSGSPKFDDWFELYNAGNSTADISGYYLTDNSTTPFQFEIPDGVTIPAGGRLFVWADGEMNQNTGGDLHVSFQLSADGELIALYAPDGTEIDRVTFGPQLADVSEGRCPDGSTNIVRFTRSTPRTANSCAQPPQLQSIQWVNGKVNFNWSVTPGYSFAVEYKDNLTDIAWTQNGDVIQADGASYSLSVDPNVNGHRFYRLKLMQ